MIVDTGKIRLLNAQAVFLGNCEWALYTNVATITAATVLADLTEAAWTGYARVSFGSASPPAIVGGRAQTVPSSPPVFGNSSGASQNFEGWFLVDPTGTPGLVAAVPLGTQTIPDGLTYGLSPAVTDTQE